MRHRIGYNRLGRKASHRKALLRNLAIQLFRHERIKTTKSKALEARRFAEKLITRAREDSVHNRRLTAKLIHDKEILAKLFTDIAPRYVERPGGYTRILKLGRRNGDAAEMVLLELVEQGDETPKVRRRRRQETAIAEEQPAVEEPESTTAVVEEAEAKADETAEEPDDNTADSSEEEASADQEGQDAAEDAPEKESTPK